MTEFDRTRKFVGNVACLQPTQKPDLLTTEQRKGQRKGRL